MVRARGFTLVDVAVALAVVGVVASMALPSMQAHLARGRRAEAVAALTRVQAAQEQYRAHQGLYAPQLGALPGAASPLSTDGHYAIALEAVHAGGYIARARLRDDTGPRDSGCAELTLTVADGVAAYGPSARCWNR
jgi:type IV pilus assembly protein PilE